MPDLILTRFQGGICGGLSPMLSPETPAHSWAIFQAKKLIELGKLEVTEEERLKKLTTSEIAVASLPLILFFHENPQLLAEKFTEITTRLNQPRETLPELLIWSKAITLGMTGKLQPETLLEELLNQNSQTQLEQQLEQIKAYLKQNYALAQVVSQLSRRKQPQQSAHRFADPLGIALALYCFLFTPTDFALATTRANRSGYQPEITTPLTGALAGVYNGYHGIPLRLRLSNNVSIANRLYASWCGATPTLLETWLLSTPTVGIGSSLQKRPGLQLISQQ